jgi:hypothetical protein
MKRIILPAFFTACVHLLPAANAGNSLFAQNVGIGTVNPQTKLHVANGASGASPFVFSPLVVESNGHTYINLLSPAINETAILFGQPGSSANGVIMYNNTSTLNGFQFRNNGNLIRMVINSNGNVGINTLSPAEKLEVAGDIRAVNMKATNFIYATPKTFHYTLSGMDFIPIRTTDSANVNIGNGGITMEHSLPNKNIVATVHLPDGAVMQTMTAYISDISATDNLRVIFYRKTITSVFFPDNIGFVISAGSDGILTPYPTPVNTFLSSNVVDNSIYTYYIVASPVNNSPWTNNRYYITAVIIEYTLSTAQ